MIRIRGRTEPATCTRVDRLLHRYLDGELDPRRDAVVGRHLATCARCRAAADELRALVVSIGSVGTMPADAAARVRSFADELLKDLDDR